MPIEKEGRLCPLCGALVDVGCAHAKEYSANFLALAERKGVKNLLEGSLAHGSFKDWERDRRFIAQGIDRDGTVLDIGCANGLLLRSLQEWSEHQIVPYGVDNNEATVQQAREMFPEQADNFFNVNDEEAIERFPKSIDTVYWNVWDNAEFEQPAIRRTLNKALELTKGGGRVIFGFYHAEKLENWRKIEQLRSMGLDVSILPSPESSSCLAAVLDQPSVEQEDNSQ